MKASWCSWRLIAQVVGTLAILWLARQALLTLPRSVSWHDLLRRIEPQSCVVFVTMFVGATYLRAYRFGRIIRTSIPISWRRIILHYPWLFMISAITPFRAGDAWRAVWVTLQTNSRTKALPPAISCLAVERLLDLVALILFGSLGLLLASENDAGVSLTLGNVYLLLTITLFAVIGLGLCWSGHLLAWFRLLPLGQDSRLRVFVEGLVESVALIKGKDELIPTIVLTAIIWTMLTFAFFYVLDSLFPGIPLGAAFLTIAAVNFVNLISAIPANVGTYQAASMAALKSFGIGAAAGFMAGVILQTLNLLTVLALGLASRVIAVFYDQNSIAKACDDS